MKSSSKISLYIILLGLAALPSGALPGRANASQTLWYRQPAAKWIEALPVGNGRLGAMVFGDFPRERIQFNEESVWAGCKTEHNADAKSSLGAIQQLLLSGEIRKAVALADKALASDSFTIRSHQSAGDVIIDYTGANFTGAYPVTRYGFIKSDPEYRRELDLETGVASSTFVFDGVRYTQEVFASAVDDIIAIRIRADQAGKLTIKLSLAREMDATAAVTGKNEITLSGQIVDLPRRGSSPAGMHMKFASRVVGRNKGGTLTAINNSLFVENADEVVFYLTAATDYNMSLLNFDRNIDPAQKCAAILSRVAEKSYESVKTDHAADHAAMFNRVSLNLFDDTNASLPTDKRLEAVKNGVIDKGLTTLLFQYGRYMLMGSSRAPGILPANLQGIWNEDFFAAWNADYHTNINVQMNYWPAEVCNLPETFVPLDNLINALRVPGRVTARKTYNSAGWTMNHATDVFGRTAITDAVSLAYPIAATWLVLHQWEHFLFTRDLEYLRKTYPTMREAADFILDFLIKDKNGKWVTAPSVSPENRYRLPNDKTAYRLTHGATKDIQLIRALFHALIEAGNLLGEDKKHIARLQSVLEDLPPTKISPRYGIIQEWIEDYEETDPGHRHISHLYGLYPGSEITPENKPLFEAAAKTLARREEHARKKDNGKNMLAFPGWSISWLINFHARLGNGDAAWDRVLELQRKRLLSNLFSNLVADPQPPFQIEANFGYTAGIAEMLLQSHQGNLVSLLPALPKAWDKGEARGLKARGNITVDMKWENNRLVSASLVAASDCVVRVNYNGETREVSLKKGQACHID